MFTSSDGTPAEAPSDGIQIIVQWRTNGIKQIIQGSEYYYHDGYEWRGGYLNDLEKWLRKELPSLKHGRQTDADTWHKVKVRALQDG